MTKALLPFKLALGLIAIAFISLVVSPPVQAADGDFVFNGRGWGHGVGMSQWGAWQAAREGETFETILDFYYPGTTLESFGSRDPELKVRLSANPPSSSATTFVQVDLKPVVTDAVLVKTTGGSEQTEVIGAGAFFNVFAEGGKVKVVTAAGAQGPFDLIELRPASGDGRVDVQMKTGGQTYDYNEYWGTIRVQPGNGGSDLWVYNFVHVDKYVRDIGEVDLGWAMPSSSSEYAPEAVKAQAVAARTYAMAKGGSTITDGWADQYYAGYRLEAKYPALAEAAEDTAGLIVTYQGEPASTYFSAHSGGYTTDSAWGGSGSGLAYIVAQPDPWSLRAPPEQFSWTNGPAWAWTYTISPASLSDKVNGRLKDASTGKTIDVGLIGAVEVASRDTADPDSHARTVRFTGSKGSATVTATSLKSLLGLRSTLILNVNGGEPLPEGQFYDVYMYGAEISRVVTSGLLDGYGNGLFGPENPVTRWQFAKIAVNLHNLLDPSDPIAVVNVEERPFDDVPTDSSTTGDMSDWVAAAKNAGLVLGTSSTTFAPYNEVRRDQMATMVCRALGWDDEAAGLSENSPGFADVPGTSTHWGAATYLNQLGIIAGYVNPDGGDNILGVGEPIKRMHVAVILCRLLDYAQ